MLPPVTQLQLDDVTIDVTFKRVKHLRLTIYPPDGRVRLSAPTRARPDAVRAFALSKLPWIKRHQLRFRAQAHEVPPEHPALDDRRCRAQLRSAVPPLVEKWSALIGVTAQRVYFRRMKTLWGSCNPKARTIRLNTELARRPVDCLEYVIVHELTHMLEPSHNRRFKSLMDQFLPHWTHYRKQLNQNPIPRERQ
jgi:predicted metal-dependent hydrolase